MRALEDGPGPCTAHHMSALNDEEDRRSGAHTQHKFVQDTSACVWDKDMVLMASWEGRGTCAAHTFRTYNGINDAHKVGPRLCTEGLVCNRWTRAHRAVVGPLQPPSEPLLPDAWPSSPTALLMPRCTATSHTHLPHARDSWRSPPLCTLSGTTGHADDSKRSTLPVQPANSKHSPLKAQHTPSAAATSPGAQASGIQSHNQWMAFDCKANGNQLQSHGKWYLIAQPMNGI